MIEIKLQRSDLPCKRFAKNLAFPEIMAIFRFLAFDIDKVEC